MRAAGQARSQRRGQIGHGGEVETPRGVNGVVQLRAAVSGLSERRHERAQFGGGFSEQVDGNFEVLAQAGRAEAAGVRRGRGPVRQFGAPAGALRVAGHGRLAAGALCGHGLIIAHSV